MGLGREPATEPDPSGIVDSGRVRETLDERTEGEILGYDADGLTESAAVDIRLTRPQPRPAS